MTTPEPLVQFREACPFSESAVEHTRTEEVDALLEDFNQSVLQSASLFARMVQIAALRSKSTGKYENGLDARFLVAEIQDALSRLHIEMFTEWLTFPLRSQIDDLAIYLASLGAGDRAGQLKQLLEVGERSIPHTAIPAERQLFLLDLKLIETLVRHDV